MRRLLVNVISSLSTSFLVYGCLDICIHKVFYFLMNLIINLRLYRIRRATNQRIMNE
jgi:hypothetical protein